MSIKNDLNGIFRIIFPSNICKAKAEDTLTDALHQCAHRSISLMRTTENIKLIQKAKRRDPDAFTELINLYMKDSSSYLSPFLCLLVRKVFVFF